MINAAYFTAVNNSFVNIGSIIPSFRDDNIGTILMDSIDVNSDTKVDLFDLIYIINRESSGDAYFICN